MKKHLAIILAAVAVVGVLTFVLLQKNAAGRADPQTVAAGEGRHFGRPGDGEHPRPEGGQREDRRPPEGMKPPEGKKLPEGVTPPDFANDERPEKPSGERLETPGSEQPSIPNGEQAGHTGGQPQSKTETT